MLSASDSDCLLPLTCALDRESSRVAESCLLSPAAGLCGMHVQWKYDLVQYLRVCVCPKNVHQPWPLALKLCNLAQSEARAEGRGDVGHRRRLAAPARRLVSGVASALPFHVPISLLYQFRYCRNSYFKSTSFGTLEPPAAV